MTLARALHFLRIEIPEPTTSSSPGFCPQPAAKPTAKVVSDTVSNSLRAAHLSKMVLKLRREALSSKLENSGTEQINELKAVGRRGKSHFLVRGLATTTATALNQEEAWWATIWRWNVDLTTFRGLFSVHV